VSRSEGDRVLIVDPDVHVFLPRWDARFQACLESVGADVLGVPYPWWKLGKYHDFPAPVFLLASVDTLRELGNDWRPFAATALGRGVHRLLRQVVRLGGLASRRRLLARPGLARFARRLEALVGICAPDTGYRLAAAARRRGLSAYLLPVVEPHAAAERWGVDSALADVAREFELFSFDGRPAVAHRYSSGSAVWRTPRGADDRFWRDRLQQADRELASQPPGATRQ
jgi:hypothetical protein